MKSFKEYLIESKKVYEFKVKIAGKCPDGCASHIKQALAKYSIDSCSEGKSTPIQERYEEFPNLQNVELTIFDVTTHYPANSVQVRTAIAECAGIPLSNIIVRNLAEDAENEINHAHDEKTGEALLSQPYEKSSNQDTVGEKHKLSFLKELSKQDRTTGTAYKGVNDKLLAKKAPSEKKESVDNKIGTVSAMGSKKVTLPDPMKGR
jgi:hypothetical protein